MHQINNRKTFSGKRASQHLTLNFKSISREKGAHWGNRFVRDHYDLNYDADPYSISKLFGKKNNKKQQIKNNQTIQQAIRKYQYSPYKPRQMSKTSQTYRPKAPSLNPQLYKTGFKQYQKQLRNGLQTAPTTAKKQRYNYSSPKKQVQQIQQLQNQQKKQQLIDNYNTNLNNQQEKALNKVNLMGISPFQFQNTIKGKMLTKSNHHIDFSKNKTKKINNVHRKYYDYSKDIQKDEALVQRQKYKITQKIHPFKSYSSHKLFHRYRNFEEDNGCGRGGQLDKFYQIYSPKIYNFNHQITDKNSVDYVKMTQRPDLIKKLGTNLQYDSIHSYKTLGLLDKKKPILTLNRSQKKLVIGRQVISPRRGCFR